MDFEFLAMEIEEKMDNAIYSYESNITKISTGRANPKMLDTVKIDYYETLTPLHEISSVSTPEPMQLLIKPFDITITKDIASVINSMNFGIHAVDEGDKVRMSFPQLTTERRRELAKSLNTYTEQARILIRNARQEANKIIGKEEDLSEDSAREYKDNIQSMTDKYIEKIKKITTAKEKDLMTI
ncbi:MAG: ribosome recycling factor [Mycoplasmataceae bacterium]|nr:ribosome recycling factor [Mycoplasmataceae bacterium]